MRRATAVVLVLMGGGVTAWSLSPSAECRQARAGNLPNADALCRSGSSSHSSSGHGYSSGWRGSSGGGIAGAVAAVRGGFGAAGHAAAAGS